MFSPTFSLHPQFNSHQSSPLNVQSSSSIFVGSILIIECSFIKHFHHHSIFIITQSLILSSVQSSVQSLSSIIQPSQSIQFSTSCIQYAFIRIFGSILILSNPHHQAFNCHPSSGPQTKLSSPTPFSRRSSPGPYMCQTLFCFHHTGCYCAHHKHFIPKPQSTVSANIESGKHVSHHNNGMTLLHYIVPSDPICSVNPSLVQSEIFSPLCQLFISSECIAYSLPSINPSLTMDFPSMCYPHWHRVPCMDKLMARVTLPSPSHTTYFVTNHLVSLGSLPKLSSTVLLNPTTHHSHIS